MGEKMWHDAPLTCQGPRERGIMPAPIVYTKVRELLNPYLDASVDESTRERLALLVTGIIGAEDASPARVARALRVMGLSQATSESIERRLRRIENDPEITASLCFHPFARERLRFGSPSELLLVLDPTLQEDHVVMLTASVWYRGRALPLAWAIWPANQPLADERLWERVEALLNVVAELLPVGVVVTWLADRAFGTPSFTDLLKSHHWHYVVRVQGQTHCLDQMGRERCIRDLVKLRGQRAKLRGRVFKKRGWREGSVVVYWGRRHKDPLCLVSDLPARWWLIHLYRSRYAIEAMFRDYKSSGWDWEQGQVRNLSHVERLLVGMALATWLALLVGTQVATEELIKATTRHRRTRPEAAKYSLFQLGLQRIKESLHGEWQANFAWQFSDWSAPNWQQQISSWCFQTFLFGGRRLMQLLKKSLLQQVPVRP